MKIHNKTELSEEQMKDLEAIVPLRYKNAWLENTPKNIQEWVVSEKPEEKRGLFIYGNCGTGKTFIMQSIRKNLKLEDVRNLFWNSTELASHFREEATEHNTTIHSLLEFGGVIMIDDFCAEKYSEFLEECFYRVINKSWDKMTPIIISSNFSLKEISERIGDRIASRIAGMCTVIEVKGNDKRV